MGTGCVRPGRHARRGDGVHTSESSVLPSVHGAAPDSMNCPSSLSRYRWVRNLCSLACAVIGCCSLPAGRAQSPDLEKPLLHIDDDIWLQETGGKRRRLLQGEKFTRGNTPFSYIIDSFRWSPNGRLILAQLITTSVVDEHGTTQDSIM